MSVRSPRTFIAVVVTIVWASLYGVQVIHPSFSPPPAVSSVMLVVVMYLFATEVRRKNGSND